jgi:hypothetical protein|tara:strand:+ start:37938 stop:38084 length:147 start_codon:yes stop_codon:yes gene_type:complete
MLYLTRFGAVATKDGWLSCDNGDGWHYDLDGKGIFVVESVIIPEEYAL